MSKLPRSHDFEILQENMWASTIWHSSFTGKTWVWNKEISYMKLERK